MELIKAGFKVAIGFGVGKIVTDILSEVAFSRLHRNDIYKGLCMRREVRVEESETKSKSPIGFCSNTVS